MKISDLQIDGFGVWSDLKLERFSDGLTVFCGPNEAGKTTLMQFIRSVLYGFSTERRCSASRWGSKRWWRASRASRYWWMASPRAAA